MCIAAFCGLIVLLLYFLALLQVMVVVKYLFQFGFFPWNSVYEMTLNEDKPFFPPRILGLEKTDNYIRYDLLQLLALFFHRSLLMVSYFLQSLQQSFHVTSVNIAVLFCIKMHCCEAFITWVLKMHLQIKLITNRHWSFEFQFTIIMIARVTLMSYFDSLHLEA